MARPKKRTNDPRSIARDFDGHFFERLPAYYRASKRTFPTDDRLVFDIARALLKRLSQQYEKDDVRQVYHEIQLLIIAEETWKHQRPTSMQLRYPDMDLKEWMAYYGDHLHNIAFKKKSRKSHWPPAFIIQRAILEMTIRDAGYPENDHDTTQLEWLRMHGKTLDDSIRIIPCWCEYRYSVGEIEEKAFLKIGKVKKSKTVNQLVRALLAEFHGIKSNDSMKDLIKSEGGTIFKDGLPNAHSLKRPTPKYSIEAIIAALTPPFPPFTSAD